MIRISQIKLRPGQRPEELEKKIRKLLKLPGKMNFQWQIVKSSIDARKKPEIYLSYTIDVTGLEEQAVMKRCRDKSVNIVEPVNYQFPPSGEKKLSSRPVIVGTGPAGLFCGYMLACHGYRPILLERGQQVEERCKTVEAFWETGVLDTECNVQFGEGGAGTFSDGKLNTLVKDKEGRNREVLRIFVEAGAPENILYEGKPHIGTDVLVNVVKHMRQTILAHGGEVRFQTKMKKLLMKEGRITGVLTEDVSDAGGDRQEWRFDNREEISGEGIGEVENAVRKGRQEIIETDMVVLAIGHSARDTFQMLYDSQVPMEAKAFAVGLRVEHPQKLINHSRYGIEEPEFLPPASYKLTAQTKEGRSVYSFCMCPGGYVVNASSEEGRLAVNGMSYSKRNGENSNSAVVVSVTPEDYGSSHPLGGLAFQRRLEEKAYEAGKGKVPVERYGDFRQAVIERVQAGQGKTQEIQKAGIDIEAGVRGGIQRAGINEETGAGDDIQKAGKDEEAKAEVRSSIQKAGIDEEAKAEVRSSIQKAGIDEGTEAGDGIQKAGEEIYPPQIKGQWQSSPVHDIMPDELNLAFLEGMEVFGHMIDGFASEHVLLSGIESRTSSPVRIHRDASGQSKIKGLYPCGEGAGYAGGITSAAMDGIRIAELIAKEYRPIQKRHLCFPKEGGAAGCVD